jgi:hypothetical protein
MDIKESIELLNGIELIAVNGAKIAKDGINISDLAYLVELAKNFEVLKNAYEGINLIDDEIKELDEKELVELGLKAFSIIKNVKAAM